MNCPKCNEKRLDRLRLTGSLGAWHCPGCGGIWVPEGKALGAKAPDGLLTESDSQVEQDSRAGLCPEGHGILTRAQTHLDDGFYLERCVACNGVWFDRGEWQRISAAGLSSGLFEIWTEPWQREQWQRRAESSYAEQLESELGEELVAEIAGLASTLRVHPARSLAMAFFMRLLSGDIRNPLHKE